jgi:hypothetical protein
MHKPVLITLLYSTISSDKKSVWLGIVVQLEHNFRHVIIIMISIYFFVIMIMMMIK